MSSEMNKRTVEALQSGDLGLIQQAFHVIRLQPTGEESVRLILESMLEDTRFLMVSLKPIYYGEVRYGAGEALATEYAKINYDKNIELHNVVMPLYTMQIAQIARENGFKMDTSLEELLLRLDAANLLERRYKRFPALVFRSRLERQENRQKGKDK